MDKLALANTNWNTVIVFAEDSLLYVCAAIIVYYHINNVYPASLINVVL